MFSGQDVFVVQFKMQRSYTTNERWLQAIGFVMESKSSFDWRSIKQPAPFEAEDEATIDVISHKQEVAAQNQTETPATSLFQSMMS